MNLQLEIRFSRLAEKQIAKLPRFIQEDVRAWVKAILANGIREVRKKSGYHDEPLKGNRSGQRSVRLNRSYRIIYEEQDDGHIEVIVIIEVNKHDY